MMTGTKTPHIGDSATAKIAKIWFVTKKSACSLQSRRHIEFKFLIRALDQLQQEPYQPRCLCTL